MRNVTTIHTIEVTIHHKEVDHGTFEPAMIPRNDLQQRYKDLLGADHVYLVKTQTFESDAE